MNKVTRKSQHTSVSTFASRTSPSTDQSLQKSFHLSHADKIELKKISYPSENKKYATAQTNKTQTMTVKLNADNGLQRLTDRRPTGNIQGLNEALLRFNLVLNEAQVARP